ncbi:MAG: hypothetical protein HUJ61_05225 [Bacilli bacterium]|nr:hypothetical protein [Bacilli bacterium]
MIFYKETISQELMDEINDFLFRNPNDIIPYWEWRNSLELHKKAYNEIIQSTEGFREEFDSILKYYQDNRSDDELNAFNVNLLCDINNKLADLYSRYIKNLEVRNLLKSLANKRYS